MIGKGGGALWAWDEVATSSASPLAANAVTATEIKRSMGGAYSSGAGTLIGFSLGFGSGAGASGSQPFLAALQ